MRTAGIENDDPTPHLLSCFMRMTEEDNIVLPAVDQRLSDLWHRTMVASNLQTIECKNTEISAKISAYLREVIGDAERISVIVPEDTNYMRTRKCPDSRPRAIVTQMDNCLDSPRMQHRNRPSDMLYVIMRI